MTTKDAINPSHYKDGWSNGAEVIDITENLNFNGGNAVKYAARSTRLDAALNKGSVVEDLKKAIWYLQRELERVGGGEPKLKFGDTAITVNAPKGSWFPDRSAYRDLVAAHVR